MRVAIFVDAGYLYSAGASLLTGSAQNRGNVELQQPNVVAKLGRVSQERTNGVPLLRVYWYDGLLHGQRSMEQEALAKADNVKVRLGTVTAGRQKGVDSLIVTDLIELARNHAISDALLLSGDEDIRIGVQIAQSFGVRVHLLGIEPSRGNQSNLLREESDTNGEWAKEDIQEILALKPPALPRSETYASSFNIADSDDDTSKILDEIVGQVVSSIGDNELSNIAAQLARGSGLVPVEYDRRLLTESGKALNRLLEQHESRHLRDKFKTLINGLVTNHPTT